MVTAPGEEKKIGNNSCQIVNYGLGKIIFKSDIHETKNLD
jgi:hypothetical protein